MAEDIRQSGIRRVNDEAPPCSLPSVYSPWRSNEPAAHDGNTGPNVSNGESSQPAPETVSPFAWPFTSPTRGENVTNLPSSNRMSSLELAAESVRTVSPLTPKTPDRDAFAAPRAVVSTIPERAEEDASDSGSTQNPNWGQGRRARFTEMLGRPLSSERSDKNSSSAPTNSRAADDPSAQAYDSTETFAVTSVESLQQAANHQNVPDDDDPDELTARYAEPPVDCHSRRDVYIKPWSWLYVILIALSIYSTCLSALWLVVSIYQPRYGRGISSSEGWKMVPTTATLLCTLIAKTIELSFVTVFVAFLGQVLTRRALTKSNGMTLAEMTMRNWVIQPGSMLTYWDGIPSAATTLLGILALLATICSMLYTTASDAMVSPKLKFGGWESRELDGRVMVSYANPYYVLDTCSTPIDQNLDEFNAGPSCLDVQYSGQSYHNLLTFMNEWRDIHENGTSTIRDISRRPTAKHNLYDNTTMDSSWIEAEFGDTSSNFATYDRIINNVTLAMPHPGVYAAATDPKNNILQPNELSGTGEYSIRASVVSPAVNVMCVNMAQSDLAPLIYTEWPNARTMTTDIPGQRIGVEDWYEDVPVAGESEWLNRTAADDVFRWGPKYQRRPPVFQLLPIDFNMVTNTTVVDSDAIYILAKSGAVADYTLCEMRSWVTTKCSTEFDLSGLSGGYMKAHCEDAGDANAYDAASGTVTPPEPSVDWKNMADHWRLSMDLNGGSQNNNASNARILTNLILGTPALDPLLPSMAEALAVLASSTLVVGATDSTFRPAWSYAAMRLDPAGVYESFRAAMRTQEYTSSHAESWQAVFYAVLAFVFVLNLVCLAHLVARPGLVSDYTEPQNLFAVAVNSPPSRALAGSCGHGPDAAQMVVPWRVAYAPGASHYFFDEAAGNSPSRFSKQSAASGAEYLVDGGAGRHRSSYKRLNTSRV
ncbi:hypothetical protein F4779DRAFT_632858 [Xylariaceae sp. FL0662B]|nr:hypothetical protein F4779DRAFT_632858 [Xylariaceae sp. FL0662B]